LSKLILGNQNIFVKYPVNLLKNDSIGVFFAVVVTAKAEGALNTGLTTACPTLEEKSA
jgi:hypothetical protein